MLSVVTWKWRPQPGYHSSFEPECVNTLARMVARHYPHPHRFVCVTDDPVGIDSGIEIVKLWNDFANVPSPHGRNKPSCYRRLRLFHPDAGQWFGDRYVSLDLDCVITGDLTPLWNRPEDVVFWGDTNRRTFYNGSMMLLKAGSRPQVWTDFNPQVSPRQAMTSGQFGSDQGWISYRLGKGEARWTAADGVYSYRNQIQPNGRHLPGNARVVMFHGRFDPWVEAVQARHPWIRQHYR
jgi:hypothetical protein